MMIYTRALNRPGATVNSPLHRAPWRGGEAVEKAGDLGRADILAAVPHVNRALRTEEAAGRRMFLVPVRRPRWLVPPLSWLLPFSPHRRLELDEPGLFVLGLCDGRRTVETIIELFAAEHLLSFREARAPVLQVLRLLTERGLVALAVDRPR
jgi:hypothetical protein